MRRMHVCGFQLNPRLSSTLKPFTHIHARINPLTIIPTHTHTKNSSVINQPPNTTTYYYQHEPTRRCDEASNRWHGWFGRVAGSGQVAMLASEGD